MNCGGPWVLADRCGTRIPWGLTGWAAPFLVLLLSLGLAVADQAPAPQIRGIQKTLEEIEAEISRAEADDAKLLALRARVLTARESLGPLDARSSADAAVIQRDLEALGPAPAKEQPPEPPGLRARRKALEESLILAEATQKEAHLLESRLERLLEAIKVQRRAHFTEALLAQTAIPLNGDVWAKALPEALSVIEAAARHLGALTPSYLIGVFWLALGLLGAWVWLPDRLISRALGTLIPGLLLGTPALKGLLEAVLGRLLPLVLITGLGLMLLDPIEDPALRGALRGVLGSLGGLLAFASVFGRLLRIERSDGPGARKARRRVSHRLFEWAGWLFLIRLSETLVLLEDASLEGVITAQCLLSGGVALRLIWSRPLWRQLEPEPKGFVFLVMGLGLGILGALASGFVALGHLLTVRGVQSLSLLLGLKVLLLTLEAAWPASKASPQAPRERQESEDSRRFWILFGLESLLVGLTVTGLLFLWSLDRRDLWLWLKDRFDTVRIGKLTLSPSGILAGMLVFLVLLGLTRLIQSALEQKIFQRTRLDSGLRHSIRSGIGYLGFAAAAMVGISVMGFDLSNLALIAGALSVGIGFGLQNIVNNFISGLILLIERPIKAGDWVVVGEYQGVVRKISVRATELMTFDRTCVFIPNSSLIAGAVQNKTHPDRVGRIILPFTLDPDTALEIVEARVLALTAEIPEIRKKPAPAVFVTGFDEAAVHLELVLFIQDVDRLKDVTSRLYRGILAYFTAEGLHPRATRRPPLEVVLRNRDLAADALD